MRSENLSETITYFREQRFDQLKKNSYTERALDKEQKDISPEL